MNNNAIFEQVDKLCEAIRESGGGGGGGGGSVVMWEQLQTTGEHIANIKINGTTTQVYAPSGGGGGDTHIYTSDEKIVGVWLDGRPVYEKSIEIEVSDGPNFTFTVENITNDCEFLNMEKCIYPTTTPFQICDVWGAATNVNCSVIFHNDTNTFQYGGYAGTLRMTLTYLRISDL